MAAACFWLMFPIAISSMTMLGGNRRLPSIYLSGSAAFLFAVSKVVWARSFPQQWAALLAPPAALFATVLISGQVQATPGLMPQTLTHEAWSGLVDHPPLSVDPTATCRQVAKLAAYAACFWVAIADFHRIDSAQRFIAGLVLSLVDFPLQMPDTAACLR